MIDKYYFSVVGQQLLRLISLGNRVSLSAKVLAEGGPLDFELSSCF